MAVTSCPSTPRWCQASAGSRPRRVRGRSGSTQRRPAVRGAPPQTRAVIPQGLCEQPAPPPVMSAVRLPGSRLRAADGQLPGESRPLGTGERTRRAGHHPGTGGPARRVRARAVTSAARPRATMSVASPRATGYGLAGVPPRLVRRPATTARFPPVRHLVTAVPPGRPRPPVTVSRGRRARWAGTPGRERPARRPVTASRPRRATRRLRSAGGAGRRGRVWAAWGSGRRGWLRSAWSRAAGDARR